MKNSNIENLVIFRSNGIYGYTVRYKSGRSKSVSTGSSVTLPGNLHEFMKNSPYSVAHDDVGNYIDYHEVIYYDRDIRTQSAPVLTGSAPI